MRILIITLCLLVLGSSLLAWPIRIQSWNTDEDVKTLNSLNVSIDYVNRSSGVIHAYVRNSAEEDKINAAGILTERMPDLAKEYAAQLYAETKDGRDPMRNYYSLAEYEAFMQQTAAQYPAICQLVQFGTSVQNRPLYFMKISDNVASEENEPELKYVSTMHGDEVVGYDLMIRLIQLLTTQYGNNTRITDIVNNTEIWINPNMNPDGTALVQRYNAQGIDLNRNFPMPTGEQHPDGNAWAPETIAMMDFSLPKDFDLGLNFHGGALVINYPWDYTYSLAPDDLLLREMSLTYSRENTPMYNSTEFPQGITNGAAWYVTTGCMQDWNYGLTDNIELTAEVSMLKWPNASTLDTFWAQNQESLLKYIEFAQKGISGIVTNGSGTPLAATITVAGNTHLERTDMPVGDYHRLLLPGTYQLTASATGYIPQTVSVTVPASGSTIQNFSLAQAGITNLRGQVRNLQGQPIPNATINLSSTPVSTAVTDAQGLFQLSGIYEGAYEISISATGFPEFRSSVNVAALDFRNIFVMQPALFTEDFENGMGNWTVTGNWGIVANSGSNVLTDSPSGNYGNNQNRTARLTNPISLVGVSNPAVAFRCKYALESGYDFVYVEASSNGSTWTQLGSFTGNQTEWVNKYYSLNTFGSASLYFRFKLSTDSSETADGIYIDDLEILGTSSSVPLYGDVNSDGVISYADAKAVVEYSIDLNPLPVLDPAPWEATRLNNADADNNDTIDAFDGYLILKMLQEPSYLTPSQSGLVETVTNPTLNVTYDGLLRFIFSDIDLVKSFSFSTSPINLESVSHQSFPLYNPFVQGFNSVEESYGFAGYNIDQSSLYAALSPNPESFTLHYTLNGVSGSQFVNTSSANEDEVTPTLVTALLPNTPNPFNPDTTIHFSLGENSQQVTLAVYNLKGQLVRTLMDANLPQGRHKAVWNGKDDGGSAVASGVYLYRLQTPNYSQTRKMLLSK